MEHEDLIHLTRHEYPIPREQQEAYDFINDLNEDLAFAKQCKESPTPQNLEIMQQKTASLVARSYQGTLRYPLKIKIPENIPAETSLGSFEPDKTNVREDIVTELRDIRLDQVVFYSDLNSEENHKHWLTIFGHDFEVEPILPGADTDNSK